MRPTTAQKLEKLLIKTRSKEKIARRNAQISSLVFWSTTLILVSIAYQDIPSFFSSSAGLRMLIIWTIPAAWYIVSWRFAQKIAGEWQRTKKTIAEYVRPGFCSHESHCNCREQFLQNMENRGIDLYF